MVSISFQSFSLNVRGLVKAYPTLPCWNSNGAGIIWHWYRDVALRSALIRLRQFVQRR